MPESTSPRKEEEFSRELSGKLKLLILELKRLINGMPDSHHDLEKIAKHLLEVGQFVTLLKKEGGHEPADVIHHIFNQPLTVPGSPEAVSIYDAAQNFQKTDAYESDLFKILSMFHEYPGPTHTLIAELEILTQELNHTH